MAVSSNLQLRFNSGKSFSASQLQQLTYADSKLHR